MLLSVWSSQRLAGTFGKNRIDIPDLTFSSGVGIKNPRKLPWGARCRHATECLLLDPVKMRAEL